MQKLQDLQHRLEFAEGILTTERKKHAEQVRKLQPELAQQLSEERLRRERLQRELEEASVWGAPGVGIHEATCLHYSAVAQDAYHREKNQKKCYISFLIVMFVLI